MPRYPALATSLRCLLCASGVLAAAGLAQAADLGQPSADDAIKVGVVTAVNPQTYGQAQAREAKTVTLGNDVLFSEHFATEASGQAQLFFLDQSSLTLGPNSEVTVDEFVYDPRQETGELATSITKGVLRYVGGRISKQADVIFTTPTAVIGVRGGIALIDVAPNGTTRATFLYGQRMTVTSGGKTETVLRPGYSVTVDVADAMPSDPEAVTEDEVSKALQSFQGPHRVSSAVATASGAGQPRAADATASGSGEPRAAEAPAAPLTAGETVLSTSTVESTSLDDNQRRLERRFDNDPDISQIERIAGKDRAAQFAQSQLFAQSDQFAQTGPFAPSGNSHQNHGHQHQHEHQNNGHHS